MDREPKTQRPGAVAADAHDAAAPGRSTLVDSTGDADAAPAIPRLDLRPGAAGRGLPGTTAGGRAPESAAAAPAPQPAGAQPAHPPGPQAPAAPQPAGAATAANAASAAPAAGAPAANSSRVTHRTAHVAPDGGTRTRTTVAVGEIVHFTATVAGTWNASAIGVGQAATGSGTEYPWKAPSRPGPATITFTPAGPGQAPVVTQMTVLAPTVDYRNGVSWPGTHGELRRGAAGVMMHSRVVFGPDSVSFANTTWKEDVCPPTQRTRYFSRWRPRDHDPENPDAIEIDQHNHGPIDESGYWNLPSTDYGTGGEFEWDIPTNYFVYGDGQPHLIRNVPQRFSLAADGALTVTKGQSTVTRRP